MKKNLLFLLATAAVATGCSKDSVLESDVNTLSNAISFDTYKGITKGTPIGNNDQFMTADSTFGVTTFIEGTTDPYMGSKTEGIKIICDGSAWDYDNINDMAYWPVSNKVQFYAYTPYVNTSLSNLDITSSNMTFDYNVVADASKHIDLMFASTLTAKPATNPASVVLPFRHALSQIHFKVATSKNTLKVNIKENGIVINNIKNEATFSLNTVNDNLEALNSGWTFAENAGMTNYVVPTYKLDGVACIKDEGNIVYSDLSIASNAVMLLPQTFVAKDLTEATDKGMYLTVYCKLYQVDPLDNDAFKGYLFGDAEKYAELQIPISGTWGRNQKITYNLLIGEGGLLEPISFTTTVETWEPVEGGTIKNP